MGVAMSSAYNWPAPGCLGLWYFEDDGDDSSGNNWDGTPSGGITYWKGKFGRGVTLSEDTYALSYADAPRPTSFTILCWIKTTHTDASMPLLHVAGIYTGISYTLRYGFYFGTGDGKVLMLIGAGSTVYQSFTGPTVVCDGDWHHIAVTRDDDYARIYVDGRVDRFYSSPVPPQYNNPGLYNTTDAGIGYATTTSLIDELQLLDYALSPSDMRRLYAFQMGRLN